MDTTTSTNAATQPDSDLGQLDQLDDLYRDAFARAVTIDAFGSRHGRSLDWGNFRDRHPGDPDVLANGRRVARCR